MVKVVLDSNVYDSLGRDDATLAAVCDAVATGALVVVVTRTLAEELRDSPFHHVLNRIPYKYMGNTVARMGLFCCGDRLGRGEMFDTHLGRSKHIKDALIADAANCAADWLVTEDKRLRRRMSTNSRRCLALPYSEFKRRVEEMNTADNYALERPR